MSTIKIATWNINSVRLRIEQVIRFLKEQDIDVLCLQEIKCEEPQFPYDPFREAGYEHIEVSGMKGYHGTATVSKIPLERLPTAFCPREEARHVSTRIVVGKTDFELHNFYIPAGGDIADPVENLKFKHKLDFLATMNAYFTQRFAIGDDQQVLVGDFNIAPHENDVWSHKQLLKVVSHTPLEVGILKDLQDSHDFIDVARALIDDDEKLFSWWSYRSRDINKSDRGRRLDHIWVSQALKDAALCGGRDGFKVHRDCRFWERPSDHAPIVLDLNLP
ncbi:exodeoxyribonuclease III [Robiginitomaculum antarcticum]|uniref:exodeoxyribonuclease III n=1 Tax=Robiginitomaculum antarcticum TaxID=437507 RepID=UPI000370B68A|nr:exodeoxyribonuclease III [Robiginitomaculum antarcticum]